VTLDLIDHMVSDAAEAHPPRSSQAREDTDADGLFGIEFAPHDRCGSISFSR
jgi:hypothetical protein